jgi:hypothetical protein
MCRLNLLKKRITFDFFIKIAQETAGAGNFWIPGTQEYTVLQSQNIDLKMVK